MDVPLNVSKEFLLHSPPFPQSPQCASMDPPNDYKRIWFTVEVPVTEPEVQAGEACTESGEKDITEEVETE